MDVFVTKGVNGKPAEAPKLLKTLKEGESLIWQIPNPATDPDLRINWNGNFFAVPSNSSGTTNPRAYTLAEFDFNALPPKGDKLYRDSFDISTVPPGDSVNNFPNGPRSAVVAASLKDGFTQQEAYGYNVGIGITPLKTKPDPDEGLPAGMAVSCAQLNGECKQSIQLPNDTAVPKQQTIAAMGDYAVDFYAPVAQHPVIPKLPKFVGFNCWPQILHRKLPALSPHARWVSTSSNHSFYVPQIWTG